MIFVKILVVVELLFVADIICAMEVKVKLLEIGTTGRVPCGNMANDSDVRVVQLYKSRKINVFENGDPSLASWTYGVTESLPNYYMEVMEHTTFSVVIEEATSENDGLYKCSVLRGDLLTETKYFTRIVMYALPRMDLDITLDTDLNRVRCTVEHVKPLIYPWLNFDCISQSTETDVVLNEDGTFTTSVGCKLPQNKSVSRLDCSFSYLHYKQVTSLDLHDTTTDSLIEDKTTSVSPIGTSVTFTGDGRRAITNLIIISTMIGCVLIVTIVIVSFKMRKSMRKYDQGLQNWNRDQECKEEMNKHAI